MAGPEFVGKLLEGERSFIGIKLPKGYNLAGHEGYDELLKYLEKQNLRENPVTIDGSLLIGLQAPDLYLPYVQGMRADLGGANLGGANLGRANLGRANLREANLGRANLGRANLERADLGKANLWEANLERADLGKADLRGVINLNTTLYLGDAVFRDTVVTVVEQKIIKEVLESKRLFDIRS